MELGAQSQVAQVPLSISSIGLNPGGALVANTQPEFEHSHSHYPFDPDRPHVKYHDSHFPPQNIERYMKLHVIYAKAIRKLIKEREWEKKLSKSQCTRQRDKTA